MATIDPTLEAMLKAMIDLPTRDNVLPKYQILLQKINLILDDIRRCKTLDCASLQAPLSALVYREKINEYSSINNFVSDFDRADDANERAYLFNKTKKENLRY